MVNSFMRMEINIWDNNYQTWLIEINDNPMGIPIIFQNNKRNEKNDLRFI